MFLLVLEERGNISKNLEVADVNIVPLDDPRQTHSFWGLNRNPVARRITQVLGQTVSSFFLFVCLFALLSPLLSASLCLLKVVDLHIVRLVRYCYI